MNSLLQDCAREQIIVGLVQLPKGHNIMFKKIYGGGDTAIPIEVIVKKMPTNKLDEALSLVQRSLVKEAKKEQ